MSVNWSLAKFASGIGIFSILLAAKAPAPNPVGMVKRAIVRQRAIARAMDHLEVVSSIFRTFISPVAGQ